MTADALIAEYQLLDHTPDAFGPIVELAAAVAGVPMATINILTSEHQHQVSTVGFDASVCRREDSMCTASVEASKAIVVADASRDARFSSNPFVTGEIGSVRFYATHPLVTPSGVIIGTLCVFDTEPREIDTTQRHALETLAARLVDVLELARRTRRLDEALREVSDVRDELKRSNDHLSAFAGQVSHDLVGPLSTVTMSLHVLEDEIRELADASPVLVSSVESGLRGADRMAVLIREVLAFARVGGALQWAQTDLGEVARAAVRALGIEDDDARIELSDLPVVRGDAVQLGAVLQNFLDNALKFSADDSRVEVSGGRDGDGWLVMVADRGIGISAADATRVFEPLARVESDVEGSGIGLATCRRIIEAHGGTIGLEPRTGGGTVAWFQLPA